MEVPMVPKAPGCFPSWTATIRQTLKKMSALTPYSRM